MCYNCGCGMPEDDMGQGHALVDQDGKSITDQTFEALAKKWNTDGPGAKELVHEMLEHTKDDAEKATFMSHLYEVAGESQGMTKDQAMEETNRLLKRVLKK